MYVYATKISLAALLYTNCILNGKYYHFALFNNYWWLERVRITSMANWSTNYLSQLQNYFRSEKKTKRSWDASLNLEVPRHLPRSRRQFCKILSDQRTHTIKVLMAVENMWEGQLVLQPVLCLHYKVTGYMKAECRVRINTQPVGCLSTNMLSCQ